MSKRFPTALPEIGPGGSGTDAALQAMKNLLELMTGDRDKNSLGVPRLFVQRVNPVGGMLGDIWINTDSDKMFYYHPDGTWHYVQ